MEEGEQEKTEISGVYSLLLDLASFPFTCSSFVFSLLPAGVLMGRACSTPHRGAGMGGRLERCWLSMTYTVYYTVILREGAYWILRFWRSSVTSVCGGSAAVRRTVNCEQNKKVPEGEWNLNLQHFCIINKWMFFSQKAVFPVFHLFLQFKNK